MSDNKLPKLKGSTVVANNNLIQPKALCKDALAGEEKSCSMRQRVYVQLSRNMQPRVDACCPITMTIATTSCLFSHLSAGATTSQRSTAPNNTSSNDAARGHKNHLLEKLHCRPGRTTAGAVSTEPGKVPEETERVYAASRARHRVAEEPSTPARAAVVSTTSSVWCIAVEYFRLFRHGYKTPVVLHDVHGVPYELDAQLNFLRAVMAPDVTDGSVYGPEAIMEQWRRYSACHDDLNIELQGLKRGPQGCIVASTMTSVTVTEEMLHHAFPHLLKDEAGQSLAVKLLGWRFVMRGSVRFDWDDEAGRVKSLVHQSDILTPMLKQLGSLDNMARVFDQARITLDDTVNPLQHTHFKINTLIL